MTGSGAPRFLRLLVVVLLALHLAFSVAPSLVVIRNDFVNYYVTARACFEGRSLDRAYERDWLETERARSGIPTLGFFIPNPPPNALLLLPLAGLAPHGAKAIWSAFLALCLLLSFLTLRKVVAVSPWLLALVFLLPSASIKNALLYGPPYPLLLLLLCLSLLALLRGRDFACGLLLAPAAALKLYGLVFLPYFLLSRRFRAAAGFLTGLVLLACVSVAVLGTPLHSVYLREMLQPSLTGRILDPYSTNWQSLASLSRRLLEHEPELNPQPLADRPALAEGLAAGLPVVLVFLGLMATKREKGTEGLKTDWAILSLASLAASSMPATYHFVLLALPVTLLIEREDTSRRRWLLLAVHAFCTSSLPHILEPWAAPRLWALLLLLGLALHRSVSAVRVAGALAVGALSALAVPVPGEEAWRRIDAARGLITAAPVACGEELAWVTTHGERYVVRTSAGQSLDGASPRCFDGRLLTSDAAFEAVVGSVPEALSLADVDPPVFVDRHGRLRESTSDGDRVLAVGRIRRPRLSPDGSWIAYQSFEAGSWDIRALERATGRTIRVTHDRSNEVEPAWSTDGDAVYFASDRRRGLGATALYVLPFPAITRGGERP